MVPPTEIPVIEPTAEPQGIVAAPTVEVPASEMTVEVPIDAAAQSVPTVEAPVDVAQQPEQTAEVPVEVTPEVSVETTEVPPLELPANGGAQGNGAVVEAAANVNQATPVTNPNSAQIVPTENSPVDVSQPTAEVPTLQVVLPTSDASTIPTIDPGGSVPLEPTIDPALMATADTGSMAEATEAVSTEPISATVSGVVTFANLADHSGIVVTLRLPDGTTAQTVTDASGAFFFGDLLPGNYQADAGADGYLSRHMDFSINEGQAFILPPTTLLNGDTNLDNAIDLSDAALIASNFDGPATVPAADVNHDGWIDVKDLTLVGADFGQTGPMPWQ